MPGCHPVGIWDQTVDADGEEPVARNLSCIDRSLSYFPIKFPVILYCDCGNITCHSLDAVVTGNQGKNSSRNLEGCLLLLKGDVYSCWMDKQCGPSKGRTPLDW